MKPTLHKYAVAIILSLSLVASFVTKKPLLKQSFQYKQNSMLSTEPEVWYKIRRQNLGLGSYVKFCLKRAIIKFRCHLHIYSLIFWKTQIYSDCHRPYSSFKPCTKKENNNQRSLLEGKIWCIFSWETAAADSINRRSLITDGLLDRCNCFS